MAEQSLEQQCVDTIRTLSIDAVEKASSGHPGMPMGMADVAYVLWAEYLRHNPSNPEWIDRDRFILSAGHGSMLLYSLLHLTGYDLPLEELKQFRQWNSKTPGHPEYGLTAGVETTTGPLGQGFANGVGMAIAETFLNARFRHDDEPLVDHHTYAIVSDGDLMEGISQEATSLAGHLGLGKLIYFYDSNRITIDGSTDLAFTEDVGARFEAYGWHTIAIDGHDRSQVREAIDTARAEQDRPSLIICRTHIGFGSPNKQDDASAHGAPLGGDEVRLTKEYYGWDPDREFYIPDDVLAFYRKAVEQGKELEQQWRKRLQDLENRDPEQARLFNRLTSGETPDLQSLLPQFDADGSELATRKASGKILHQLSGTLPNLFGGSADLSPSNNTRADVELYTHDNRLGRYIHYGVREHAMVGILNGMNLHKGVRAYGGTFLIFSDYCRPSIRLAALSHIPTLLVFTHDSIGLGEDGPTHQPIEHLSSLRAMPNMMVLRPADANETAWCWKIALERSDGPAALALTRQGLPVYDRSVYGDASGTERGAYVLADADKPHPDAVLIATGSEVQIAVQAREQLLESGIDARVVSMPCMELFRQQPDAYKDAVLPPEVECRVSIEAGATQGWSEWTGTRGKALGLDHFGASAPWKDIYRGFGLTGERVAGEVKELVEKLSAV